MEKDINENVNENENNVEDFIKEVEDLKKNSVSREDYEKLLGEKKKLMSALINGDTEGLDLSEGISSEDLDKRITANREKLAKGEVANDLEYWETVIQLREDVIEKNGEDHDPFLPNGHNYVPNADDKEKAERVANTVKECIESAEGDPNSFKNDLMRRIKDTSPIQAATKPKKYIR
ncbi:MAG: hypothetical protein J6T10_01075 [Methanobrevibacter sp.]|nr:hypothetical protein [Methanobrevibacter sp.]